MKSPSVDLELGRHHLVDAQRLGDGARSRRSATTTGSPARAPRRGGCSIWRSAPGTISGSTSSSTQRRQRSAKSRSDRPRHLRRPAARPPTAGRSATGGTWPSSPARAAPGRTRSRRAAAGRAGTAARCCSETRVRSTSKKAPMRDIGVGRVYHQCRSDGPRFRPFTRRGLTGCGRGYPLARRVD